MKLNTELSRLSNDRLCELSEVVTVAADTVSQAAELLGFNVVYAEGGYYIDSDCGKYVVSVYIPRELGWQIPKDSVVSVVLLDSSGDTLGTHKSCTTFSGFLTKYQSICSDNGNSQLVSLVQEYFKRTYSSWKEYREQSVELEGNIMNKVSARLKEMAIPRRVKDSLRRKGLLMNQGINGISRGGPLRGLRSHPKFNPQLDPEYEEEDDGFDISQAVRLPSGVVKRFIALFPKAVVEKGKVITLKTSKTEITLGVTLDDEVYMGIKSKTDSYSSYANVPTLKSFRKEVSAVHSELPTQGAFAPATKVALVFFSLFLLETKA